MHVKSQTERFWEKVLVGDPDTCWPWLGGKDTHGYGVFRVTVAKYKYRMVKAHRFCKELFDGLCPDKFVCHHCDNPCCVNPRHLYYGTPSDNVGDAVRRGRNARKLTPDQVRMIVAMVAKGAPRRAVAEYYGIAHSTVNSIVNGQKWQRITGLGNGHHAST